MNDKRLRFNYVCLTFFLAELAFITDDDERSALLGEMALNLPAESLLDIKKELVQLRKDELLPQVQKVAA